ncbi:hypothetical protein L6164_023297 [Bauhinia variegata]|uniref:Uncharacterized protein n=1 Tax=Bauhinia variegata TaxID=167791 RepID=A0ACB9MHT4_BAUVA|nr:hypothetical protein L6164_023297 [Bauhinia variegata]
MLRPRTPTSRIQPSVHSVYEDFQPKSEITENPEAQFLQIYLPGFTKPRVRITYVNSSQMVTVIGERPINGSNKWSRFNQAFPVPENCQVEKLQSKFDQGILTITIPKKFLSQVLPPKEEKISSPPKTLVLEAKPEKAQEMLSPKSTTARVEEEPSDKKGASFPTPQNGQEGFEVKPQVKPIERDERIQEEFRAKLKLKLSPPRQMDDRVQKGAEETRQRTTFYKVPTSKQTEEKTTVGDPEKERTMRKEVKVSHGEPSESRKPGEGVGTSEVKEKESKENIEYLAKVTDPNSPTKISEREKETAGKAAAGTDERKNKEEMIDTAARKGIKDVSAATSMALTRIREGALKHEEKNLLVKMGAAVMVIAALGVYVSYRFVSSGKS